MKKYSWLGLVFIAALILPHIIGEFWIHVAIEILIFGLFAVSFNLLFGYMGQLSFGHAAYFGVGAYATGLLMLNTSIPLSVCLLGIFHGHSGCDSSDIRLFLCPVNRDLFRDFDHGVWAAYLLHHFPVVLIYRRG